MGVDITLHIEVQIADRWEHYAERSNYRDYKLWSLMGKGWSEPAIVEPRGLPDDANAVTRIDHAQQDVYDASWLSAAEIAELVKQYTAIMWPPNEYWSTAWFGYLFRSESWTEVELPDGVTDFRFVFWFDQ